MYAHQFSNIFSVFHNRLRDFLLLNRSISKLEYILLRQFRVLISKGFCSYDITDGGEGDEDGSSNLKFEDDVDGTGMGEGNGKVDVTDQIENEEQLLGLKDNDRGEEKKPETQH